MCTLEQHRPMRVSPACLCVFWLDTVVANARIIRHTRGLFFGLTVCCPPLRLAKLAPLAGMTEWDSACIGGGAAG